MVKMCVMCYFLVENVCEVKFGVFVVWYVDVDVEVMDMKMDV